MIIELGIALISIATFLMEQSLFIKFCCLFVAMMSIGFAFDNRRKLEETE